MYSRSSIKEKSQIKDETFNKIDTLIKQLMDLDSLKEKINLVLNLEYGFILDKIKDKAKKRYEMSRDPVKTGIISKQVRHNGSNRKSILKKENFDNVPEDSEFSDNSSLQTPASVDSISNNPNLLIIGRAIKIKTKLISK